MCCNCVTAVVNMQPNHFRLTSRCKIVSFSPLSVAKDGGGTTIEKISADFVGQSCGNRFSGVQHQLGIVQCVWPGTLASVVDSLVWAKIVSTFALGYTTGALRTTWWNYRRFSVGVTYSQSQTVCDTAAFSVHGCFLMLSNLPSSGCVESSTCSIPRRRWGNMFYNSSALLASRKYKVGPEFVVVRIGRCRSHYPSSHSSLEAESFALATRGAKAAWAAKPLLGQLTREVVS